MKLFLLLSAGRKTSAAGGCGHFPQWCTYPSVIPMAQLRDTVLAAQAAETHPIIKSSKHLPAVLQRIAPKSGTAVTGAQAASEATLSPEAIPAAGLF